MGGSRLPSQNDGPTRPVDYSRSASTSPVWTPSLRPLDGVESARQSQGAVISYYAGLKNKMANLDRGCRGALLENHYQMMTAEDDDMVTDAKEAVGQLFQPFGETTDDGGDTTVTPSCATPESGSRGEETKSHSEEEDEARLEGGIMDDSESHSEDEEDEDEDEDEEAKDGPLPSVGSATHWTGDCKRCCFFPKGRCQNGYDCEFCHFDHAKRHRKKNKKKKSKAAKIQKEKHQKEENRTEGHFMVEDAEPHDLDSWAHCFQVPPHPDVHTQGPNSLDPVGGGYSAYSYPGIGGGPSVPIGPPPGLEMGLNLMDPGFQEIPGIFPTGNPGTEAPVQEDENHHRHHHHHHDHHQHHHHQHHQELGLGAQAMTMVKNENLGEAPKAGGENLKENQNQNLHPQKEYPTEAMKQEPARVEVSIDGIPPIPSRPIPVKVTIKVPGHVEPIPNRPVPVKIRVPHLQEERFFPSMLEELLSDLSANQRTPGFAHAQGVQQPMVSAF